MRKEWVFQRYSGPCARYYSILTTENVHKFITSQLRMELSVQKSIAPYDVNIITFHYILFKTIKLEVNFTSIHSFYVRTT